MLEKKIRNVRYAMSGIRIAWQEEFSFKVQIVAALLALLFGLLFRISQEEWLAVIIVMGFVLTAEAFNTALEELCDKFQPEHDPHIAKIKDLAAAAVLISSATALTVGAIIFTPRIIALLS